MLWRYDHDGTRWAKRPYQPSGALAKTNGDATWCSFNRAATAMDERGFDGIGFVLGDGWAGIDVDDYIGQECNLIERIPGYRELSPSGTGIKVIGRCARMGGEIDFATHPPTFTAWTGARFFTITGQQASGDPLADLSTFMNDWFPAPAPLPFPGGSGNGYRLAAETSDDDLLLQMIGSDNGEDVYALWQGDTSRYGGDHSRADLALASHLAFWTNYDMPRVDRLFRQSGLMRAKWDRTSYRNATLRRAMQS